ncbi:MAG TPA: penicillin acylase family protein, partial [Chloroflexota bacterium]|nr:penicillin acylase family protein [Chloroflexota bacterium]
LDYEPEPWTIADVLVALRGFWWSLNGRLQSIVAAEAASILPEGPLRDAYLTPNLADERILPPGTPYPDARLALAGTVGGGNVGHGSDGGTTGSNNWAVGKRRTTTGSSILASDPHQGFALPSNWYECHLVSPAGYVAGAAWAGAPGIWFGRNQKIAWGLTNNNVSLRDLYVEDVDPTDSTRYRDGTTWRTFDRRPIDIAIKGQPTHRLEVRSTVRGPIVNHLIPRVRAEGDPPLALRWVGLEPVDDLKSLLAIGQAQSWNEFRTALRDWSIPTFNWGFADVDGNVGYQCASRVPLRGRSTRGFRDANDPRDRWQGYLPFEAQPTAFNPERGFVSSANQAPVPDDYPFPYTGAFASGERAIRIRESIEATETFDRADCIALQNDTMSVAARQLVPRILERTNGAPDPDIDVFRQHLARWDYRYEAGSPG